MLYFLFPKFLELFFTPKNTPPKSKNSQLDKIPIFGGHPIEMLSHLKMFPNLHASKMNIDNRKLGRNLKGKWAIFLP